ncbi:MSHA biogenesis protein MshL [Natronospira proteinivora]|uniref:MSHA biogenesis protein MshL n=1 Tax=Natronospira proteinivora TaxID=1807133 RepID=A0ABT1GB13_9GAMM|nr:pilus (MSHA type) biogenesis protein MshL [Natronospira proteinivora]MCP1728095.1 MSHA biogenesis protein MshL [Natronospira proteinivora]
MKYSRNGMIEQYRFKTGLVVLGIGLSLVLGACAQPFGEDTRQRMDDVLEDSLRATEERSPPAEVSEALLPGEEERRSRRAPAEEEDRFDISVRNVDAETFFMGLVEDTDYNMIVDDAVEGRISLSLRNVTIPEVMEAVEAAYGYEYRELAGGYLVRPAGLQTRVFTVDYLTITREGSSSTRVSSGSVSDGHTGQRSGGFGGTRGFGGSGGGDQSDRTTGTRIETESKSDFWADIESTLEAIVADRDGSRVILNPQSGTVAVRALPAELREIQEYLATIQESVGRQVVLEAKILEVELRDEFRSGINWGGLYSDGDDAAFIGQTGGPDLFEDGVSSIRGTARSLNPGDALEGMTTESIGGTFAATLNIGNDFRAFVELLSRQGETRVLSSPRVSTVNNQKAVIKVGSDEFFVTGIQSGGTFGAAGASSQRNVELTPFFSGIALDVTPQISANNDVTLHIHPTVSQVTDQRKDLTVGGETDSLPLALSEVRESDSIVRASSGQIVVIGGLMQNQMRDETFRTPILGDIPVLGHLFRQTRQREAKTELVILLRPVVVEDERQWDDMTREYQGQIRDMRRPGRR